MCSHVRSRPGLVALLVYFAGFNFVVGFVEVAEDAISGGLGRSATTVVLGGGLVGMVVASAGITIWGTPRDPVGGQPASSTGILTNFVGTGRSFGRGFAFMTMVVVVLVVIAVLLARRRSSLRYLDTSLPDVTSEDLPSLHGPLSLDGPLTLQGPALRPTIAPQSSAAGEP